jgi:hypothetical protein
MQPERAGQRVDQGVELLARPRCTGEVVRAIGFVDLALQILHARAIFALRTLVERDVVTARFGGPPCQLQAVHLVVRPREQDRQIAETFDLGQRHDLPVEGERPPIAVAPERRRGLARRGDTEHRLRRPLVGITGEAREPQAFGQRRGVLVAAERVDVEQPAQRLARLRLAPERDPLREGDEKAIDIRARPYDVALERVRRGEPRGKIDERVRDLDRRRDRVGVAAEDEERLRFGGEIPA